MAKFQSPLLGYNNNVRHKNRVFHIQTEDSGVNHPHIITHLFMDGGRILKSVKRSYAEHVGTDGMNETVRQMMKEQHKAMFIALRDGQFDHLLDGGAPKAPAETTAEAPAGAAPAEAAAAPAEAADAPAAPPPAPPEPPAPEPKRPAPQDEKLVAAAASAGEAPVARDRTPSGRELTLDFDAIERASHDTTAPLFQSNDLPPRPKNLFAKERGTGTYRAADTDPREEPTSRVAARAPASGRSPQAARPAPSPRAPSARPSGEGRYAPARPAAIFGATQKPPPQSIFSDELVSDKSLDEVILSYLAEDLEPPRRK